MDENINLFSVQELVGKSVEGLITHFISWKQFWVQPREEEGTRLAALLDTEDTGILGDPLISVKVTVGPIIDPAFPLSVL